MNPTPSAHRCPRCGGANHGSNGFDCPGSVVSRSPLTPISQGLEIGDYSVEAKIGAGGMGVVYRASHKKTGKRAAIKVLSGVAASDANAVRRFVLEIRTLNEIHHPNLVNIYSFGQLTDGRYYYVMEYLEGCSLGALIRGRGRLTAAEALPVFLDVCQALEATHAKGIVHRDLKPDNVFLAAQDGAAGTRARTAKLLDFGLAKLVEERRHASPQLTAAGMAVGTPQYMAPEQCKAQRVDARTDLYALGVMMYEALTGRLPFDGHTTIDIWDAHVRRQPRPPLEVAPDNVSGDLDSIILTLLAKRPDERFASAGAVAAALSTQLGVGGGTVVSLDTQGAITTGASASDVARAIPSAINSMHMIPLGGEDSGRHEHTAETRGLKDLFATEMDVSQPALESENPAQASALDIDLAVPDPMEKTPLPAWATRGGSSARLTKIGPPPRRPKDLERRGRAKVFFLLSGATIAALIATLLLR